MTALAIIEEAPAVRRERKRDLRGGLWTLSVAMGYQLVQPVGYSVQVVPWVLVSGHVAAQEARMVHRGQKCHKQQGQPEVVWSQGLSQNGKRRHHLRNLSSSHLDKSHIRLSK